jgi:ubiquitin-conjugating enzyme E2 Z
VTVVETIRISVCDKMESILGFGEGASLFQTGVPAPKLPTLNNYAIGQPTSDTSTDLSDVFNDVCKRLFLCYYDAYTHIVQTAGILDGQVFENMPFESSSNGMNGSFKYSRLQERLVAIKAALLEEIKDWVRQSRDWLQRELISASFLSDTYEQIKHSKELEGMDIELEEGNPYMWNVLIFGPVTSHYDGGMFRCRIVFHNKFPEIQPRVQFSTPLYHPQVTQDGFPCYRVARQDDIKQHLSTIYHLLEANPDPHPATHVNMEAARMYFGDDKQRKEYFRNVRKCAARSMDY